MEEYTTMYDMIPILLKKKSHTHTHDQGVMMEGNASREWNESDFIIFLHIYMNFPICLQ